MLTFRIILIIIGAFGLGWKSCNYYNSRYQPDIYDDEDDYEEYASHCTRDFTHLHYENGILVGNCVYCDEKKVDMSNHSCNLP